VNDYSTQYLSYRTGCYALAAVKAWLVNAMLQLWRAGDLGPVITFVTGVVVGLLIPSYDWPAIITVIVGGVVLETIVKTIDRKCAKVQKS
jgi:hypothetical protein